MRSMRCVFCRDRIGVSQMSATRGVSEASRAAASWRRPVACEVAGTSPTAVPGPQLACRVFLRGPCVGVFFPRCVSLVPGAVVSALGGME
jgi:hypothetical protein